MFSLEVDTSLSLFFFLKDWLLFEPKTCAHYLPCEQCSLNLWILDKHAVSVSCMGTIHVAASKIFVGTLISFAMFIPLIFNADCKSCQL